MQEQHDEFIRLVTCGDLRGARAFAQGVAAARPKTFIPHLWLARLSLREGRLDAVRGHMQAAEALDAPERAIVALELALAEKAEDAQAQLGLIERLLALEPSAPDTLRRAAAIQLRAGRHQQAIESLERFIALLPDAKFVDELAALESALGAAEFLASADRMVLAAPANWSLRIARAAVLAESDRMDLAWKDIEAALALDPDTVFPTFLQQALGFHLAVEGDDWRRLQALVAAHPRAAAPFWSMVMVLDSTGQTARAREVVRANWDWARHTNPPPDLAMWEHLDAGTAAGLHDPSSPVHYQLLMFANRLEDALACAPHRKDAPLVREALALSRSGLKAMQPQRDPGEVTIAGEGRPNGTVLVFTGLRDQAWLPAHVMDLFFAALGLRAVYLRDYSRLAFLGGLRSLGATLDATLDHLAGLAASRRAPLYTMGMSVGGMGAVAYAEALGARASLVFSPQSTYDPAVVEQMGDRRGRAWYRRLRESVDATAFDMSRILPRMPEDYRLTAWAGAANVEDQAHLAHIARFPNVTIRLLEGEADHSSLGPAAAREPFLRILARAFGLPQADMPAG